MKSETAEKWITVTSDIQKAVIAAAEFTIRVTEMLLVCGALYLLKEKVKIDQVGTWYIIASTATIFYISFSLLQAMQHFYYKYIDGFALNRASGLQFILIMAVLVLFVAQIAIVTALVSLVARSATMLAK
ncbi:MAG: hypothetical protein ACRYG4_10605 [Janthinobacterium lividum]